MYYQPLSSVMVVVLVSDWLVCLCGFVWFVASNVIAFEIKNALCVFLLLHEDDDDGRTADRKKRQEFKQVYLKIYWSILFYRDLSYYSYIWKPYENRKLLADFCHRKSITEVIQINEFCVAWKWYEGTHTRRIRNATTTTWLAKSLSFVWY